MTNRRAFLLQLAATGGATRLFAKQAPSAAPRPRLKLRFAVASDGHFGQPETDFELFHKEMIGWLNDEARSKGLDFVVFNGDLIHNDPTLMPQVKQRYDRLEIPYFANRGNHDKVAPGVWKEIWGYPENHSFERGDYAFLLACTSNEKGDYLPADVNWLRQQIDAFKGKKGIFAFLHIGQVKFTDGSISSPEVAAILEQSPNILAVFHGHDHNQDNVIYFNKRSYFFDGHMGSSWGTNYRGYRIVEVSEDGKTATYQCNPQAFYVNRNKIG